MLILLSILWGGSFFFIGIAVTELAPLTIVWFRVALAALTLWAVVFVAGIARPSDVRAWSALFTMGLLNNVLPFTLIVWSQTRIESGLASILNATLPMFTVLVAGLLLRDEQISTRKVAGVIVGLSGAIVMIGPAALGGLTSNVLAQLAIILAAIIYSFAAVFGRRFREFGLHPVATAAGQVTASALILLPVMLIVDQPLRQALPGASVLLALLALAVLSTAFAYILYFKLLSSAGATNLSLVTLLIPVSAIGLGYFFLDERLQLMHLLGMVLIAIGLSLIDGRLWQRIGLTGKNEDS